MVIINKIHIKKTILKSLSLTIVLFAANIHADAVNLNFSTSTSTISSGGFSVVSPTAEIIQGSSGLINLISPVEFGQITSVTNSGFLPDPVPKVLLPDKKSLKSKLLNGEIKIDVNKIVITSFINQSQFTQAINSGGIEHSTKVTLNDDGSFLLEPK